MSSLRVFFRTESQHFLALCLCAFAIAVGFFPAVTNFSTHFLGGIEGDGGLYVWLSTHALDALAHNFTTSYLFPHAQTLAWSDMFLLPAAMSELSNRFHISPVERYNGLLLFGALLNCFFTYLLAKELRLPFWSSIFAGVTFALSDTLLSHAGHPQFYWSFFLPWTALLLVRADNVKYLSERLIIGVMLGCVVAGALLTTVYIFVFSLCVIVFWLIDKLSTPGNLLNVIPVGIGAIIPLIPTLPFITAYMAVKQAFGPRAVYEAFYLAATPLGFLAAPPELSWREMFSRFGGPENWNLFGIGIVVVCLSKFITRPNRWSLMFTALFAMLCTLDTGSFAQQIVSVNSRPILYAARSGLTWIGFIGALVLLWRSPWLTIRSAFALGIIFICLSFGPLGLGTDTLPAYSPYSLLRTILPGLDGIRACARFAIPAALFFSIATAHILLGGSNILRFGIVIASVALQVSTSLPLESMKPVPSSIASLQTASLAPGAVLILPILEDPTSWGSYARSSTTYMNWVGDYTHPLVNGYSGVVSKLQRDFFAAAKSDSTSDEEKLAAQIVGLRYLVTLGEQKLSSGLFSPLNCDRSGCLYERRSAVLPETIIIPPLQNIEIETSDSSVYETFGSHKISLPKNVAGFLMGAPINEVSPRRLQRDTAGKPLSTLRIHLLGQESPWLCRLPMFYCE